MIVIQVNSSLLVLFGNVFALVIDHLLFLNLRVSLKPNMIAGDVSTKR